MTLKSYRLAVKRYVKIQLSSRMSWTDREGEDKAKKVLSDVEISPAIPRLFLS